MNWKLHRMMVINTHKNLTMKSKKYNSIILLLSIFTLIGVGFSSCEKDEEVVPKTFEEYEAELSALVSAQKEVVENCVVGYDEGNFKVAEESNYDTVTSSYLSSLLYAEEVIADPEATIADLVEANEAMAITGETFGDNLFISDRRSLQEVIVYCDTLVSNTPEGTEVGQCPAEPRNTFIAAISEAKTWRNLSTTIERQVTEEVDSLSLELEIFEEAIIE